MRLARATRTSDAGLAGLVPAAAAVTTSAVAAPIPPSTYAVPAGAEHVSSSAGLLAALAAGTPAVVLANGVYTNPTPFDDPGTTSIFAQNLGGAVFAAGLIVGGNGGQGGAVIQGLDFDISNPGAVFQGAALDLWGAAAADTQVLDSVFDGNGVIAVGLLDYDPQGLVAARLVFSSFTDEGLRASDNVQVAYGAPTPVIGSISDITVTGIGRSTPGSSNGTAEAGLWIGEPVADGVTRVKIRNVAWSGIEICNNVWNTTFSDLDINMTGSEAHAGVGVYLEHYSRNLVFNQFQMAGVAAGFNAEWDDGVTGNAAAHDTTIENGTINAAGWASGNTVGLYLDQGTESTTVTNVAFENQNWAAIGAYRTIGTNAYAGNSYTLAADVPDLSSAHL